jgi:hypothetical protein
MRRRLLVTAAGPASKRAAAAGRAVFPAACGWVPVAADVTSEPASEKLRTKLLAEADAFRSARTNEALGYLLDRWLPSASGRLRWPVSGSIPPCSCSQRHPSDLARATPSSMRHRFKRLADKSRNQRSSAHPAPLRRLGEPGGPAGGVDSQHATYEPRDECERPPRSA